jgi:hypothetical protein
MQRALFCIASCFVPFALPGPTTGAGFMEIKARMGNHPRLAFFFTGIEKERMRFARRLSRSSSRILS